MCHLIIFDFAMMSCKSLKCSHFLGHPVYFSQFPICISFRLPASGMECSILCLRISKVMMLDLHGFALHLL